MSEQHEQEDEEMLEFERAPVDNPESVSADLSHYFTSGHQANDSGMNNENERSRHLMLLFPDAGKIVRWLPAGSEKMMKYSKILNEQELRNV
ncbi:MAG: hypothetical protein AB2L14_02650 [Candidatus Xenobiia bacterium LiM19]